MQLFFLQICSSSWKNFQARLFKKIELQERWHWILLSKCSISTVFILDQNMFIEKLKDWPYIFIVCWILFSNVVFFQLFLGLGQCFFLLCSWISQFVMKSRKKAEKHLLSTSKVWFLYYLYIKHFKSFFPYIKLN